MARNRHGTPNCIVDDPGWGGPTVTRAPVRIENEILPTPIFAASGKHSLRPVDTMNRLDSTQITTLMTPHPMQILLDRLYVSGAGRRLCPIDAEHKVAEGSVRLKNQS